MLFRRRRPIPPPLDPKIPEPDVLLVPYAITGAASVFLNYLSNSELIDDTMRNVIHQWLTGYVEILGAWVITEHGLDGAARFDELTRIIANNFYGAVGAEFSEQYAEWEREFFQNLEQQFSEGDK